MDFADRMLALGRPESLADIDLPRRLDFHPSPVDWRNEVLYFLLVDRFSDGREGDRPLVDRRNAAAARPASWRWSEWAESGSGRWQGGTIKGVRSKLDYLRGLGVTTLWLSPVFKQRNHLNTYHGYGIQDFLEVDPRFGDRRDLVELVAAAHDAGLRIILDIIFNHSGSNWIYPQGTPGDRRKPHYTAGHYPFGGWLDGDGREAAIAGPDDGVWPRELQVPDRYTRAGYGSFQHGGLEDPNAEFRRMDFEDLRDFDLDAPGLLNDLAACYKYWIALTDCDGFRIDTLKHVTRDQARNFCGAVKEFAANIGKHDLFLVGEVAGGNDAQVSYLEALSTRNMNAVLDIGEARLDLRAVAAGLSPPSRYFNGFDPTRTGIMGSHRDWGSRHVSILDDHDHVFGEKLRFSALAASEHQVAAGVALQLLTLGIPCLYYGTEQALGGPEESERRWLPDWKGSDRYLREAMFGPEHPLQSGHAGRDGVRDTGLPGFGPFGTAGRHCFNPQHGAYRRIAALAAARAAFPALRVGRQYPRGISVFGEPFRDSPAGEIAAWSRLLADEEVLCVLNPHGGEARGADVVVDAALNPPGSAFHVVASTAAAGGVAGSLPAGHRLPVQTAPDGTRFLSIRDLPPSEVLVLANRA